MKLYEKAAVKLLVKQISEMDIDDIKTQMRNIYDANGLFVNDDEIDYVSKKIKESPYLLSESLQEIILKGGITHG